MSRRELREHIFRILFRKEFFASPAEFEEQVNLYLDDLAKMGIPEDEEDDGKALSPTTEEVKYIVEKAGQVYLNVTELDEKINLAAQGWKTRRMSRVDLTIIRLALYEILFDDQVPEKVAINEAVELAKKYGGDESPAFINGVLARLLRA